MKQVLATIISNTEPMPGYHLISADAPDLAAAARPGQFVMVKCSEELPLRRPLSVHKVTDSGHVYFLFAVIAKIRKILEGINLAQLPHREVEKSVAKGEGTLWLSQRRRGEKLDLLGPLGNGFSINPASNNLLLVAGGIGIAPLIFLAQQALEQGRSVKLLLGARTKDWLYPLELLPAGIEIKTTTEYGSTGNKGMVSEILPDFDDWADQIYACGPMAMYQTIASQMQQQKVKKPVQISLEVRMGCGLGACFGCSIRTKHGVKRVCQDGPVFNLDEILFQEVKI